MIGLSARYGTFDFIKPHMSVVLIDDLILDIDSYKLQPNLSQPSSYSFIWFLDLHPTLQVYWLCLDDF